MFLQEAIKLQYGLRPDIKPEVNSKTTDGICSKQLPERLSTSKWRRLCIDFGKSSKTLFRIEKHFNFDNKHIFSDIDIN